MLKMGESILLQTYEPRNCFLLTRLMIEHCHEVVVVEKVESDARARVEAARPFGRFKHPRIAEFL